MKIVDVSPELLEKAKACQSAEEIFELAKNEGVELTEEQIDAIAGGKHGHGEGDWTDLPRIIKEM